MAARLWSTVSSTHPLHLLQALPASLHRGRFRERWCFKPTRHRAFTAKVYETRYEERGPEAAPRTLGNQWHQKSRRLSASAFVAFIYLCIF